MYNNIKIITKDKLTESWRAFWNSLIGPSTESLKRNQVKVIKGRLKVV